MAEDPSLIELSFSSSGSKSQVSSVSETVIDNSNSMMERIAQLYADRLLSDLTLVVGSKKFNAHRLILCTSSDVFQVMLMNPTWTESQVNYITLNEEEQCQAVFPEFLKYMYTGKIVITTNNVLPLLILSDKYNIQDLINQTKQYMTSHVVLGARHNLLVPWITYCGNVGHESIYNSCLNFMAWNFEFIANQDEATFGTLEPDLMIQLLSRSDLVVTDEVTLFKFISKWLFIQERRIKDQSIKMKNQDKDQESTNSNSHLEQQSRSSSRTCRRKSSNSELEFEQLVFEMMKLIRFPMMSPTDLANLLLDPLVSRFKELLVESMASAMLHHQSHQSSLSSSSNQEINLNPDSDLDQDKMKTRKKRRHYSQDDNLLIARIYKTDKWSSSLITDNFSNVAIYASRSLLFNTPSSFFQDNNLDNNLNHNLNSLNSEWAIDLYPKGIWFKKFQLIVWHGRLDAAETVIKTVRLSVTSLNPKNEKVKIAILIYARDSSTSTLSPSSLSPSSFSQSSFSQSSLSQSSSSSQAQSLSSRDQDKDQDTSSFVHEIVTRVHTFTKDEPMINLNDLVDYDSLNVPISDQLIFTPSSSHCSFSRPIFKRNKSKYLIGPNTDTFKIHVVITPLNN